MFLLCLTNFRPNPSPIFFVPVVTVFVLVRESFSLLLNAITLPSQRNALNCVCFLKFAAPLRYGSDRLLFSLCKV